MSLATIIRFQFGDPVAIKSVATNRVAILTGIVLTLLTAIARNYDQSYITESSLWLLGPLLFSFVSGTFLFLVLYFGFIRRHMEGPQEFPSRGQWWTFMGLFWMTAPIGWLYAIPVERFLSSYEAAKANLFLLAVVALWRVLLMGRIVAVVQEMDLKRAIGWVLIPASIEVILTIFFQIIFGGGLARGIMQGMAGLQNSPENTLIEVALLRTTTGAIAVLGLVSLWLNLTKFENKVQPFPPAMRHSMPLVGLIILVAVWVWVAIPAQREQKRFVTHAKLVDEGKYREAIDFLSHYQAKDFPASRRLHPDPFGMAVFEALPATIQELELNDPGWIQKLYMDYLAIMLSHYGTFWPHYRANAYAETLRTISRLPNGSNWIKNNLESLQRLRAAANEHVGNTQSDTNSQALVHLLEELRVPASPKQTNSTEQPK